MFVRRHQRTAAAIAAAIAGTTALAACGGGGSINNAPASGGGSSSGSSGASLPSKTEGQLKPAADKEGKVVWYTTFVASQLTPMIKAFNQTYPNIKVQTLRLSADQIPPRVLTEQKGGKYNADIVSGDAADIAQLIQAGATAGYDAPGQPALPQGVSLPKGHQGIIYVNTTVIAYNPTALKAKGLPVPTSYQSLTQPKWKGNFSIDPGAVNLYQSELNSVGSKKANALITALGNNSPRLVESHTQALTQVEQGEPVATATAYGYLASSFHKQSPSKIAFVNSNPLPTSINLIDIAKNPPHPSAAELFMDWLESKPGQQQIEKITNQTSIQKGVQNDTSVWNPAKWKPAYAPALTSPAQFNTQSKAFQTMLHAAG
jgi:iron(III) transport system substrate-binding protein